MPRFFFFLLCSLLSYGIVRAQQGPGNFSGNFQVSGNEISFSTDRASIKLDFCSSRMFRVRISWDREFEKPEHWMVEQYRWAPVRFKIDSTGGSVRITTDSLKIILRKSPLAIDVYSQKGELLSSESNTSSSDNGSFREGNTVGCKKMMQPDEHFFGFGERMDFLDRRGKRLVLNVGRGKAHDNMMGAYNTLEANYSPVPFFMSTRGYGIFLHNSYQTSWDMGAGSSDSYSFRAAGGHLDYYFIYGPAFTALLNAYTSLTGRSPLMPRYAMGLHVGTYSGGTWGHEQMASPAYVVALVRKFREEGIPIDILFLDSTWRLFESGGHGATTFEWRDAFTDPKAMFDSLYAMHLNAVGLHIRPRLDNGPKYRLLSKAQAAGVTYPENGHPGEFPNFFDTAAVNWWWDHAVMKVASVGAKFLKTDEGSAFGGKANESEKTGPTGTGASSLHNIFPLAYAHAPFTKFMEYNHSRGMNQTREGYAGIQKYPYIFAGDWPSQWQFFAPVIRAGLNIGLSGVGYWAHCMGGFEQQADPELYIRWCQFGMLSPVAMVFGMDHPGYKEPWNYGPEGLANFKKYDSLRYCLLPYLYTTAYQLYQRGEPIMRALVLNYQKDPNVYDITDQYLLGDNIMVCPVTQKGARTRVVYLPNGTWFNYWTGEKFEGKRYITVPCPLEEIPLFIRGGGIIPIQPETQYVGAHPPDTLGWEIYPEGNSSYSCYQDDGYSLQYQHGGYALTTLHCSYRSDQIQVRIAKPEGLYRPAETHYYLKIHIDRMPVSVIEGARPLHREDAQEGWNYDNTTKILTIYPAGTNRQDDRVLINLQKSSSDRHGTT